MALTTIDLVKSLLGKTGVGEDALIDTFVEAVSVKIARYCRRFDAGNADGASLFERAVDTVETARVVNGKLILRRYPIESITEIKQAADRDFDNATALVEGDDFMRDPTREDALEPLQAAFYEGVGMVRATYTGGYWTGDVGSAPAGSILLPADLGLAAAQQAAHEYQHRKQFGERNLQIGDMSVSQVKDDLLGIVKGALRPYVDMA